MLFFLALKITFEFWINNMILFDGKVFISGFWLADWLAQNSKWGWSRTRFSSLAHLLFIIFEKDKTFAEKEEENAIWNTWCRDRQSTVVNLAGVPVLFLQKFYFKKKTMKNDLNFSEFRSSHFCSERKKKSPRQVWMNLSLNYLWVFLRSIFK